MPETSTTAPRTLRAVFDDLKPGSANVELTNEATVAAEAKSQAGVIEWKATSSALIPEVAKLLDVPLPALLVGFWKKTDEVAAALGKSLASPTKKVDVSLFDSKTEASFDPFIEVRLNGAEPGKKIQFKVALPLTFKGVVLTIKNGEIVDAIAGQCAIEGSIKLGTVTVAKLRAPVTIPLGPSLFGGDASSPPMTMT